MINYDDNEAIRRQYPQNDQHAHDNDMLSTTTSSTIYESASAIMFSSDVLARPEALVLEGGIILRCTTLKFLLLF